MQRSKMSSSMSEGMVAKLAVVLGAFMAGRYLLGSSCPKQRSTITVTGQGSAEVPPDTGKVLLNVHSTKPSAKEAREEAATVAASVLSAVGSVNGISSSDVTTLDVSVHPQINWGEGGQQTIVGYQFNQRLQVKVQNLSNDALGAVVDAAVLAGGNNLSIDTIQAELSPALARQAQNTARAEAVEDGRAAAEVIAQAAGVRLGEILTCTEGSYSSGPGPMPAAFGRGKVMAAEAYTGTPVNVGPTTTTTSVVMEFFIMPVSK